MKRRKYPIVLAAALVAHCAQISKENIAGNTTATSTASIQCQAAASVYNSQIATHVASAPCAGIATNGCIAAFNDPTKAINGVRGGGTGVGSNDVFSLSETGVEATLILDWAGQRVMNIAGVDFIVYENPFAITGTYGQSFMDLIVVSVSRDNVNYCGFAPQYLGKKGTDSLADFQNASLTGDATQYSSWSEEWSNFAGKTPVIWNVDTNPLQCDDLFVTTSEQYYNGATLMYSRTILKGGGDGFDLDNLATDAVCTSVVQNDIKTNGFKYVKLVAAHSLINPATSAIYPHDSVSNGPDIDGVLARHVVP